jgi:putative methyltransferase (TIGR04325 family)
MKKFIRSCIPPIVIDLYNTIKLKINNDAPTSFTGVYESHVSIECQSPWEQKKWLEIQEKRLDSLLTKDNKIITRTLSEFEVLPCYLINSLSRNSTSNIVDIGGGSGLTFYKFLPYFKNPTNVNFNVVDYGKLSLIGREFSKKVNEDVNLSFYNDFSSIPETDIDIIFCSSSIQFIYEYESFIDELAKHSPKYFVITQLPVGNFNTYFTEENQHGFTTPRIMFNYNEFVGIFKKHGYSIDFEWPVNEYYPDSFFKKIPNDLRIRNSTSFIFKKY